MATHYIDPINGNDANAGTSFASRKKTLASIAGLAAGDSIRVIESPVPDSLGSVSWTDNSRTLTLGTARTLEIDPCTAAWTASTNVTCSANTSRKYGSASSRFVVASGFTTGRIAYKALAGTLDLSGYTAVSFWLNGVTVSSLGGQALTLRLCSDAAGTTPVRDLVIDLGQTTAFGSATWVPVFIDAGVALPSAVGSIRIDASVDPGSATFQINNLIACQSLSHAGHLSHRSLIGKKTSGEPEWYPINSINGTTVTLGSYHSVQSALGPAYRGTTETVTTYQLRPIYPAWSDAQRTLPAVSGTEASHITLSGGWDATSMSVQSGSTYFTGLDYQTSAFSLSTDWWDISGINAIHMRSAPYTLASGAQYGTITAEQLTSASSWSTTGTFVDSWDVNIDRIVWCDGAVTLGSSTYRQSNRIRRITGTTATVGTLLGSTNALSPVSDHDTWVDRIDNTVGIGVGASTGVIARLRGCTLENNSVADVSGTSGVTILDNCTLSSTTSVTSPTNDSEGIMASNLNGSSTGHRVWMAGWTAVTQSAVRQVASGVAWAVSPTSATLVSSCRPATLKLARVAVNDGTLVSVKCYVRRTNTGLTIGIRVKGGQVAGLSSTQVATTAAAADTWDELTITFTPSSKGVVEVEGFCHGGTTYTGYFDSLTVSQV